MKFSVVSVFAALAATVSAIPAFTNSAFDVTPGSTFTLTWTNATGGVTIYLATGDADNLSKVEAISPDNTGTSYTWSVPTTLTTANYAFEIVDSTGTNYSKLFQLTGTGSASASASTASSTAASSTSASSSSSSSPSSSSSSSSTSTTSSSSSSTTHATTTTSKSTTTATKTTSSSTSTATSTSTPANTNNGPQAKSPLALVLVTVAALLYFN